jgi:putative transposase
MKSTGNPQRQSIRLSAYDYTQPGAYFVTIVTAERQNRLGDISGGGMRLNTVGQMAQKEWQRLPTRFPGLALSEFVVMPNHFHGILIIEGEDAPALDTRSDGSGVGAQRDGSRPQSSFVSLRPYQAHHNDDYYPRDRHSDNAIPHRVDAGSVGAMVRAFKSSTTLRFHRLREGGPFPLWQRNYYEHIIRGPGDFDQIRAYILANPVQWELDQENAARFP